VWLLAHHLVNHKVIAGLTLKVETLKN